MATFNGRNWTVADMVPFKYVENWDAFFDDVIAEMEARSEGVGEASEAAIAAAAVVAPAVPVVTAARDQAVAAAATAAGIIQVKQPSEIAGIDPIIDFPFSGPAAVPSGVIAGSSGKWVMGQAGVLVNVASGTAPIDYDPVTSALRGLLVEESRTNLLTYSQQFDNAAWSKIGATVTAGSIAAPDGTMTAGMIVESSDSSQHGVYRLVPKAATAITYTQSICAKAGTRSILRLVMEGASSGSATASFDLSSGTAGTATVSGAFSSPSASIKAVGNGWYRLSLAATSNTDTGIYADYYMGSGAYTGDGASGLYLWGARLEVGSFATSYIPTTSSTVTRAADANTLLLSSVPGWNASEGTIYVEAMLPSVSSGQQFLAEVDGGSTSNRMMIFREGGTGYARAVGISSGASIFDMQPAPFAANTFYKLALAFKADDFAFCVGGGVVATDAAGTPPVVTTLRIGASESGSSHANGYIRRLTIFPRRLSNSTLQLLTA